MSAADEVAVAMSKIDDGCLDRTMGTGRCEDDSQTNPPPSPLPLGGGDEDERGSAALCVLASGSSGNCSVLEYRRGTIRRACLIDLGLSPKRTIRMLADQGLGMHQIDDIMLTHLDADHYHAGWAQGVPRHVRIRIHERHIGTRSMPLPEESVVPFDGPVKLQCGAALHHVNLAHDEVGVTAFRFDFPESLGAGSLGFATDVGRVTRSLVELLSGTHRDADSTARRTPVDVLAIESNYCPKLQQASARPEFLKRRIMGGRGHLSNHEALDAITRISPREHTVLLHLSRDCNRPEIVSSLHEGADYSVTITSPVNPTRWVRIGGLVGAPRPAVVVQPGLFESVLGPSKL